jgi:hypothetical protein
VKNYYARKKISSWEAILKEAEEKKDRGEIRPPPPTVTANTKKQQRHEVASNRPLAAADTIMEDTPPAKMEHNPAGHAMAGRFNVPITIAAQLQPPLVSSPFVQTSQAPPMMQNHMVSQAGPQAGSQPATPTMSPTSRPLRAPQIPFIDRERERERESFLQQPVGRTPLVSKPSHTLSSSSGPEPLARHPLPGSMIDSQAERPKIEPKASREPLRHQERQPMRVKQELQEVMSQHDFYGGAPTSVRGPPSRAEILPLTSRPTESPRVQVQATQAPPFAVLQHQPGRGFMPEATPSSSPATPRPLTALSRPVSGTSGIDPYHAPPAQRTPPSVAPAPARAPKTSNLMALLNDDPPAPPKSV